MARGWELADASGGA